MKKTSKRFISLTLCIVMMFGLLAVGAGAECKPFRYVAISDSCGMGYVLNDFDWIHNHKNTETGASAFANYANMMNYLKNTWNIQNIEGMDLSLTGSRPTELRAALDRDYYERFCDGNAGTDLNYCDKHFDGYISDWSGYKSYDQLNAKYIEWFSKADLITYDLIMADFINLLAGMVGKNQYSFGYETYAELLKAEGCEFLGETIEKLRSSLENALGETATQLTGLIDSMLCAYTADVVNFTKTLDIIYGLNPDVNIIVVGPYNPYRGVKLYMGSIEIDFEAVVTILEEFLTSYLMFNKHSWRYRFADCSGGVQTLSDAMAQGKTDEYSYLVNEIFKEILGTDYKEVYTAQIEDMKDALQYACSLDRISFDVYSNGAGDPKLALLRDDNATITDYEALNETVRSGLSHSAGQHPDIVGYQQKFEAIKRAFLSPVAANGAYLTRIIDNTVSTPLNLIATLLGSKTALARILTLMRNVFTPLIGLSIFG